MGSSDRTPLILTLACIVLVLAYWAYVKHSGTGYESSGSEHFRHLFRGIQLELGDANASVPTDNDCRRALSNNKPVALKEKSIVSALFGQDDCEFYIFLKPVYGGTWQVIARPKSDYKRFSKVWLTEVSLNDSGQLFLVGATGDATAKRLSDSQMLDELPLDLNYTKLYIVYSQKEAD